MKSNIIGYWTNIGYRIWTTLLQEYSCILNLRTFWSQLQNAFASTNPWHTSVDAVSDRTWSNKQHNTKHCTMWKQKPLKQLSSDTRLVRLSVSPRCESPQSSSSCHSPSSPPLNGTFHRRDITQLPDKVDLLSGHGRRICLERPFSGTMWVIRARTKHTCCAKSVPAAPC